MLWLILISYYHICLMFDVVDRSRLAMHSDDLMCFWTCVHSRGWSYHAWSQSFEARKCKQINFHATGAENNWYVALRFMLQFNVWPSSTWRNGATQRNSRSWRSWKWRRHCRWRYRSLCNPFCWNWRRTWRCRHFWMKLYLLLLLIFVNFEVHGAQQRLMMGWDWW